MKSMTTVYGFSQEIIYNKLTNNMQQLSYESELNKWLCIKLLPIICVQDIVHLGVKLKARLLKPSIILPLGIFIASSAHLQILMGLYSKNLHGLRHRDIDHRDKQNFDAVEHIISASSLLENIPDSLGTKVYIDLIQNSIYSYLDKKMTPLQRLENMWYSVFFVRYWRQWIQLHPQFSLKNNFITGNAYMCIEINAHSLLSYLLIMRDLKDNTHFTPWLLGSQSCERTFRLLRSMTGTFSTIVNFSLQGFLQRVHKLSIKDDIESDEEREYSKIKIPRMEKHKNKDGLGQHEIHAINFSNKEIIDALSRAQNRAKETIEKLGMAGYLKINEKWDIPPIPPNLHKVPIEDEEHEEDELNQADNKVDVTSDEFILSNETVSEFIADVDKLHESGIVDNSVKTHARKFKQSLNMFTKDEQSQFPVYFKKEGRDTREEERVHSPFVEVKIGDRSAYIRKTTAIWLFQDTERVSADRMFRVRAIQPGQSVEKVANVTLNTSPKPLISKQIVKGDVCVFYFTPHQWKIGRVLQFACYKGASKTTSYKGNYGNVNDQIGVLCTWYECVDEGEHTCTYHLSASAKHEYHPISNYLCTLTIECFKNNENLDDTFICPSLISLKEEFIIRKHSFNMICEIFRDKISKSTSLSPSDNEPQQLKKWVSIDKLILTEREKLAITNGQKLSDLHISAGQLLLQKQFSHLNGLQNTLYQLSKPLSNYSNVLQVLHIKNPNTSQKSDHWSVLSTLKCDNSQSKITCFYYDSTYTTLPFNADEVIAHLLSPSSKCFKITVKIVSVGKQTGSTECGLYAMAIATSLAHNIDPENMVFRQEDMRDHYVHCLQQGKMEPFPVAKTRRISKKPVLKEIYSCPKCYKGDNGFCMVQCDGCNLWYHTTCVESFDNKKVWYGPSCCNATPQQSKSASSVSS